MFVKQSAAKSSILRVLENFFTIEKIDDENIYCAVEFKVNQSTVIRQNAFTVRITSYTKLNPVPDILKDNSGIPADSSQITRNILTSNTQTKAVIKANKEQLLSSELADISSKINNSVINPLINRKDPKSLQALNRSKITLKPVSDVKSEFLNVPLLAKNTQPVTDFLPNKSVQKQIRSALILGGIDPSETVKLQSERFSAINATQGTRSPTSIKNFPKEKISLEYSKERQASRSIISSDIDSAPGKISDLNDSSLIHVLETTTTDEISVPKVFTIKKSDLFKKDQIIGKLYVKFELLGSNQVTIDIVERYVDIQKHIKVFSTPKIPPSVKFGKYDSFSKSLIEVTQNDPRAIAVDVFQKSITQAFDNGNYSYVGRYFFTQDNGSVPILLDINTKNTNVLRVVSIGKDDLASSEYTNVVIPSHSKKIKHAVVTSTILLNGVSVSVSNFPPDAVSFRVVRKNMTLRETDFSIIGDEITQIDQLNDDRLYSIVDTDLKLRNIYQYAAEIYFSNGVIELVSSDFIEFIPYANNIADIQITDLKISYENSRPEASFNISSKIFDTSLDQIKSLLEKQGIIQYFENEIKLERDSFKKLLCYKITRSNLTTGEKENFGILTDSFFSDSESRKINAVSFLNVKNQYRYDVSLLVRAPETLLKQHIKTVKDKTTGKEYTFSPAKFLHPAALQQGTIGESNVHSVRNGKDDFLFGEIGSYASVNVSFPVESLHVQDVAASRFDKKNNIITWTFNGTNDEVDYFLLCLIENGVKTPIGKCNANIANKVFQFIHEIDEKDQGDFVYSVVPIFSDYSVGSVGLSNRVVV